jgi:hypothetical protein
MACHEFVFVDALDSAVRIQRAIAETEANAPRSGASSIARASTLAIVIDGDDIVGDGVNIAAPGRAGGARRHLNNRQRFEQVVKLDLVFDDLGI